MHAEFERPNDARVATTLLRSLVTLALLAALPAPTQAQTARTFEELRQEGRVRIGDTVTVEDEAGHRVRGVIDGLGDDALTLRIDPARDTVERTFREHEVTRIRRAGSRVMAVSAFTGAGAAFAITAVAAATYGRNEGAESCGGCLVQWSTMTVPVGAALGALIGFTIDMASVRTVYARASANGASLFITPLVADGTFGGFATIRF